MFDVNTIEAYAQEIEYQVTDLARFVREAGIKKLSTNEQARSIFTGAGDSFAAAMVAGYASDHKVRCVDPLCISLNPAIVKNGTLYLFSVSGNTSANINAARVSKGTVAVTANSNSTLAKLCDEVVEIKFRNTGILTAGSISFTTTMLAAFSLIKNVQLRDLRRLFVKAEKDAAVNLTGHVYVIGNGITYPLAMYGCAKMYEVLGIKAQYAMLEQFCHMELFSVKENDTIMIISEEGELAARLGCNIKHFKAEGSLEDKLLYYSMLLQLVVLYNAKRRKLKECYFIKSNKLRNISSSLIY
jgi:glucosamine 6-phosphate synthetase-like amidotransferase/phosphosugar isomerase protein